MKKTEENFIIKKGMTTQSRKTCEDLFPFGSTGTKLWHKEYILKLRIRTPNYEQHIFWYNLN